ncbi:hypothetical protein Tco_1140497 [Tanacetum coccineum]
MANLARFKRENKTGRGKEGRTENGENIRHKFCTSSNAGSFGNDLSMSLMGRVKEMASLANLKKVLCNEGFDNLKISYLGELWVLLEFESSKAKELFRKNAGAGSWFSVLHLANDECVPDGRLAWVEVGGVPFKTLGQSRRFVGNRFQKNWGERFKVNFREKVHWVRAIEVQMYLNVNDEEKAE